ESRHMQIALRGILQRVTRRVAALNHVGVVVPDIDAVEAKVKAAGFEPRSHADYEPGKRFYFDGPDSIEFEVVSYA
ncbi:MAG: VOC family protein, partial [Pseudomonadota bacterium]